MITQQLLEDLILDLRSFLNISQPTSFEEPIAEIQNYCEILMKRYPVMSQEEKTQIDHNGGIEPMRKMRNSLKRQKNTITDEYRTLNSTVERYDDSEALEAIYHISEPTQQPFCTLATLINFFSKLAHQPFKENAVTYFYSIKNKLLNHLCNAADKTDLAIIPSKGNADSVIYYRMNGQGKNDTLLFSWHVYDKDLQLDFNPDETEFYKELAEKVKKFSQVDRSNTKQLGHFVTTTAIQPLQTQNAVDYYVDGLRKLKGPISLNDEVVERILRTTYGNEILNNTHSIYKAWELNNLLCKLLGIAQNQSSQNDIPIVQEETTTSQNITEEFTGGGSYEEPLSIIRSDDKLWEEINSSNIESIQKLRTFINTTVQCYGISLSEIIKMEIFQTAFHEGIINSKELENQQMLFFESFINNISDSKRVEMKSCGKDSELQADWSNGKKYFIIRPQANLMGKPFLWEMVGDIPEIFSSAEYQDKLQKTTGRTVSSVNNLPLIEKFLPEKEEISTLDEDVKKEELLPHNDECENTSVFEVNADIIQELCAQPDFSEKFNTIYSTMSSEKKVLFIKMLETFMPELFDKNFNRNGGQDR